MPFVLTNPSNQNFSSHTNAELKVYESYTRIIIFKLSA